MIRFRIALVAAMACLLGFATLPARAQAADPAAATVQAFHAALLDTMKNAKALGYKGRYDRLKPAVDTAFDIPQMTASSVGPRWASMSAADQKSLIEAFDNLTVASYARDFDGFSGEKFTLDSNVVTRGADKLVRTQLVIPKRSPIPFIYRLRQSGGSWKVIDILLNGEASQIVKYRADFAGTVSSGGAPALVRQINALAQP